MSTTTGIEWTETTWNPVVGCTKVSEGCRNCYAMRTSARIAAAADAKGGGQTERQRAYQQVVQRRPGPVDHPKTGIPLPQWNNEVRCIESALDEPMRWRKPRLVFVNSQSDLFHEKVPFEFIDRVFAVMALCPRHTFQILTKRPERMAEYLEHRDRNGYDTKKRVEYHMVGQPGCPDVFDIAWPLPNVWVGASVEDQATADERIPHLLRCPAAVRFLSMEPLLGEVFIDEFAFETFECRRCSRINNIHEVQVGGYTPSEWGGCIDCGTPFGKHTGDNGDELPEITETPAVHWVIVGGESGPGARPMHPEWARSVRDQCADAGVPFFFKQWGAWRPGYENNREHTHWDDGECAALVGKKAAGRLLDGVEHNVMPEVPA